MTMKDQIVNLLAGSDKPLTYNEIAALIDRPAPSVRRTVRELENAGRVWEADSLTQNLTFTTTPAVQ